MMTRILLILLGLFHISNGIFMIVDPLAWYHTVPGVVVTGPFNPHFVTDIGLAFLTSGTGLILGLRWAAMAVAGAAFPALHAVFHVWMWFAHGFPQQTDIAVSDVVAVVGVSFLGAWLAWTRTRQGEQ